MKENRKASVRDSVLETASRLFYQQGYVNTGINQIIEESGVVKSSMYQTFRSKEDILMAYLETAGATTDEALRNAAHKYTNPREKILGIFDYLKELMQQETYNGCNFLNIISEIPQDQVKVRKQIKKQKDGVRKLFRTLLSPIGKEELADDLYLLFDGALISNKVYKQVWGLERAKSIAKLLLNN